jgi:hypothetical protein
MTDFVSIYADGDSGKVVTVTEAFATGIGATVLEDPGDSTPRPSAARPRPPREGSRPPSTRSSPAWADPAKAAAALEQEKAGKNRTTLVAKLEAIATRPPPATPEPTEA